VDVNQIIFAAVSIGSLGILFGIGLGVAAKKFEIIQDPMIEQVIELLPGVNCGACGYPGCAALGKAIVEDGVSPTKCTVANAESQENLATLLGLSGTVTEKKIAFVMCKGTNTVAPLKYEYDGIIDCEYANYMQGTGPKLCEYGCLGMGSCVKVCQFDAIHVIDGVAIVDEEKCTNCGLCISACPKNIIESVPMKSTTRVSCMSENKGKLQKDSCSVGCIGCKLCAKACPVDAITIENFLAKIDYDKCISCGACVEKCPTKAIDVFN